MTTPQQIAAAEIAEWLSQAPGKRFNPDREFGVQCVDAADQYAEDIFGRPWIDTIGAVPGAKDLMHSASPDYFEIVWNDTSRHDQTPPTGSIIIWGGSPKNEWGHVAIVVSATASGVKVLQQDGFAAPLKWVKHPDYIGGGGWYSDKPAHIADLGYDNPGTGMVSGWLIPRPEKVKNTDAVKRGFGPQTPTPGLIPTATVTPQGVMHGIDTSSHQAGINLGAVSADFVIVKVTGGVDYVNPEAKAQVEAARKAGRLIGLYHYAAEFDRRNDAAKEAAHFLRHALPLMDETTNLVLDWENKAVIGDGGNVWARDWLDIVAKDTGVTPWFYGYLSAIEKHQWATVSKKYPLWLAWYGTDNDFHGYAKDFTLPFKTPAGFKLIAWQYSQKGRLGGYGGHLDLNVFFGDGTIWRGFAQGKNPRPVPPANVTPQSNVGPASNTNSRPRVHVVASGQSLSWIAEHYGVSVAALLSANAFIKDPDYLAVGDRVEIPAPAASQVHIVAPGQSLSALATYYGVSVARIVAANAFIKDPSYIAVGDRVRIPSAREELVHVVAPGQSLSWIAGRYATTTAALQAANSFIKDPNYLAVGDRVRIP